MEKRALIAIALSILVLLAFRYFEERRTASGPKPLPEPSAPAVPQTIPETQQAKSPARGVAEQPVSSQMATKGTAQSLVIDGDLYRAVLDNRGAVLTSWKLKKYTADNGEVFEMIAASHKPESRPFPGSLVSDDRSLEASVNGEFYEVTLEKGNGAGELLAPPATVILRLRSGDVAVEKRYHFERENYLVDVSISLERGGKPVSAHMLLGQDIGPEHEHLLNPAIKLQAISNNAGKVQREGAPEDEKEIKRIAGDMRWVGLDMQYFSLIAIPARALPFFEIQKKPVKTRGLDGKEVSRDLLRLMLPLDGRAEHVIFLGPKDQEVLASVKAADLSGAIDFGMFSFLVRPLLFSLKWIDRYVNNFGYSIILLTLVLTLLLFPFRIKQMLSMKKMQVVQPKVKEIQEKYKKYKKTDPRRAQMNQEVMALYKEHNVNPLGGCLPLLLQMPLLFAFYQLLASSIELRHAPFVGWIRDLSVKDPYYVLPIVMGVTMLISQKMTPMTPGTDPTQAKIMLVMPAIFTVMFLNVSSGLNLYFLCSNIFQIGFQKLTEGWIGDGKSTIKSRA